MSLADFYRGDTRKIKITIRNGETQEPISVDGGKLTVTFKKSATALDADADLQVTTNTSEEPVSANESIIVTLAGDSSSAGAATFEIYYATPA